MASPANHVYNAPSNVQCPNCSKTATILEALFNRIHVLESTLSQANADKIAANRTLYRLLDAQNAQNVNVSYTPETSLTYNNSPRANPCESPRSALERKTLGLHAVNTDVEPLIDLFDPVQQAAKGLPIIDPSTASNSERANSPTTSSFDVESNLEQQHTSPYVRRFTDRTSKSSSPEKACSTIIKGPASAMTEKEQVDSTNHADSEGSQIRANLASLHSSFDESHEVSATVEHSRWAPDARRRKSDADTLSYKERWAKYCDDIAVTGPLQSASAAKVVDTAAAISDEEILEQEGPAAGINRFRYRDTCNVCFNPSSGNQEIYRTVIIAGVPEECSMTGECLPISRATLPICTRHLASPPSDQR